MFYRKYYRHSLAFEDYVSMIPIILWNDFLSPKLYPYNSACLRCSQHIAFLHPDLSGYGTCHTPHNRAGISRLRGRRLAFLLWWNYLSSDTLTLIFQYYILDYIANCDKKPIYNVYHSEDL